MGEQAVQALQAFADVRLDPVVAVQHVDHLVDVDADPVDLVPDLRAELLHLLLLGVQREVDAERAPDERQRDIRQVPGQGVPVAVPLGGRQQLGVLGLGEANGADPQGSALAVETADLALRYRLGAGGRAASGGT